VESNTSRRRIFQDDYPPAFDGAHAVLFCKPLEKADSLPPAERLSLEEVVAELKARGIQSRVIPEVDDMVDWLVPQLRRGDIVLGISGRHFYGLHDKIVARLSARRAV
jgi:UDP-N-acetylmuramate-alanine ligase